MVLGQQYVHANPLSALLYNRIIPRLYEQGARVCELYRDALVEYLRTIYSPGNRETITEVTRMTIIVTLLFNITVSYYYGSLLVIQLLLGLVSITLHDLTSKGKSSLNKKQC